MCRLANNSWYPCIRMQLCLTLVLKVNTMYTCRSWTTSHTSENNGAGEASQSPTLIDLVLQPRVAHSHLQTLQTELLLLYLPNINGNTNLNTSCNLPL